MPRKPGTNPYRTYSDGTPKVPHLGTLCADPARADVRNDPNWGHKICGGWWCTCPCHDSVLMTGEIDLPTHVDHRWEQVGDCVYCADDGARLYQGSLTEDQAEREAMAAVLSAGGRQAAEEWGHMRREVLAARNGGEGSVTE